MSRVSRRVQNSGERTVGWPCWEVMVFKNLMLEDQRRDYFPLESRIPEINKFYKLARDVDLKMYLSIEHVLRR
jgi:hypothetical protein